MDENTWRIAQVGMWLFGLQAALVLSAIGAAYRGMATKVDKLDNKLTKAVEHSHEKLEKMEAKLCEKIEKLDVKVNDIDKRIHVVEALVTRKEGCMIKDSSQMKKAE